ncbi:polysaccharide biosynthesis tyrosine autokinase [Blastococcus sp. BMG 814]|uniref:non-specific protein-tyrosine kinase n=1 Tax=Blastococcus carthaginiensis TaxID=3050034 RepID=A0ABT9IGN8_9ACTN|nr:polysaccharide biosynthesis tyrosine autokinase [Blastococcus carthaginiensis]MDP5184377.1 polysaccharide biosynthesis tyrosine autokinase [Blastococcus carthaginiensis]
MNLRAYLDVLVRRWLTLVVVGALSLGGSVALSLGATPVYTASASLFFSLQSGSSANELAQGSTFTQNQMASYATLATTATVLYPVIEELGLRTEPRDLARQVRVTTPNETVVLEIQVTSTSAVQAAAIANSVAENLTEAVGDLAPVDTRGNATVRSSVVAPAVEPEHQTSPNTRLNLVVGAFLGLVLGLLTALAREALDTRVRSADDVRALTEAPVLTRLPLDPASADGLVVDRLPRSPQAELYRQLRTATNFLRIGGRPLMLTVTSAMPGEGKSTVAMNLALALSETSDRVLLVDADLRRPAVADRLGIEGAAGLSTVLVGRARFDDVVQEWGAPGLAVLTAGEVPPNPAELLSSPGMAELVARVRERYDVVIWDSPPVLPVTDAQVLSAYTDGVLLVASGRRLRRAQLAAALEGLRRVDARLIGVVLTMLREGIGDAIYGYGPYAQPEAAGGRFRLVARLRAAAAAGLPAARSAEGRPAGPAAEVLPPAGDRAPVVAGERR